MTGRTSSHVPLSGMALLIFICLIWGGNMVSIKFSNTGIPPLVAATIRNSIAALCLWGLAAIRGKSVWLKGSSAENS